MQEILNKAAQLVTTKEIPTKEFNLLYVVATTSETMTKKVDLEFHSFNQLTEIAEKVEHSLVTTIIKNANLHREIKNQSFDFSIEKEANLTMSQNVQQNCQKLASLITQGSLVTQGSLTNSTLKVYDPTKQFILVHPKWAKYKNILQSFLTTNLQQPRNLELIGNVNGIKLIIDDRVAIDEIILGQKNEYQEPGIVGLWSKDNCNNNEVYFNTVEIGFYPERQYLAIKIK